MSSPALPGDVLDPACPVDWGHPLAVGLAGLWVVSPNSGWSRGKTLRDLVRGGKSPHDGALNGTVGWAGAKGRPGGYGSLAFSGAASSYVTRAMTPPAGLMALGCWFRTTSVTQSLVGWNDNSSATSNTNDRELAVDGSGHVQWYLFDGATRIITGSRAVNDGKWHHALGVIDGTGMILYVDGAPDGTPIAGVTHAYNAYTTPYLVAGLTQHTAGALVGNLDGVTVCNRGPSAAEVADLYAEMKQGCPALLRWYQPRAWVIPATGGGTTPESLAGSVTAAGSLTLRVSKALAGSTTPTGVVAKQDRKPLAGSATPSGSLAKATAKPLAGAAAPSGSMAKQDRKPLGGSTTPAGTLSTLAVKLLSVAGSVAPAGAITKQTGKAVGGSAQPAGAVTKQTSKPLTGSTTPTGVVAKQVQKPLAGSTPPAGVLSTVRTARLSVVGAITAAGNLVRAVLKALAGRVTGSGALTTSGGTVRRTTVLVAAPPLTLTARVGPTLILSARTGPPLSLGP